MKRVITLCVAVALQAVPVGSAQDKAVGRVRVGTKAWSTVYSSNRSPESVCSFDAKTVVTGLDFLKSLDKASPDLVEGAARRDLAEPVELEVRDDKKSLTFVYQLQGVTITNTRTLEGGKERVTLRYKKCTVKDRKAS